MDRGKREVIRFSLSLPKPLHALLSKEARQRGISLTTLIVLKLQDQWLSGTESPHIDVTKEPEALGGR
jgi:hypothetical protein